MIEDRVRIVDEAKSWLRTPYAHRQALKGAGVDCGMLLLEVYRNAGVIPVYDPGSYPPDWHMHRSEERYLEIVRQFGTQIPQEEAQPGDAAVWKFGRTFSHGAVIVEGTTIVHAYLKAKMVTLADFAQIEDLKTRDVMFFAPTVLHGR